MKIPGLQNPFQAMQMQGLKAPKMAPPQQSQSPQGAQPQFAGVQGNLLSPKIGGQASPMGNKLNVSC